MQLLKLEETVTMMDIKEHQQVWFISFFDKKTGSGVSVNKEVAEELLKP